MPRKLRPEQEPGQKLEERKCGQIEDTDKKYVKCPWKAMDYR